MKLNHRILIAGIIILISGCINMAPEFCIPQFPDMNITYDNYVKNIISQNCINCHYGGNSAPGLGNFSTYNDLKPYVDFFNVRVISDHADMPQGNAPLPKSTRDSLDVWIKNCSPEK
jgi:hypothetical protein